MLPREGISWPQRVEEELREGGGALLHESLVSAVVELQHRADHRAGGEREDAKRNEIDEELIRGDRTNSTFAGGARELLRQRAEEVRRIGVRAEGANDVEQLMRA